MCLINFCSCTYESGGEKEPFTVVTLPIQGSSTNTIGLLDQSRRQDVNYSCSMCETAQYATEAVLIDNVFTYNFRDKHPWVLMSS